MNLRAQRADGRINMIRSEDLTRKVGVVENNCCFDYL